MKKIKPTAPKKHLQGPGTSLVLKTTLILLAITLTNAIIYPQIDIPELGQLEGDMYSIALNKAFNVSDAQGRVTYTANGGGHAYNIGEPYAIENYPYVISSSPYNFMQRIGDEAVGIVSGDTVLTIQFVDADGRYLGGYIEHDFYIDRFEGKRTVCTSWAFNSKRGYLYVGCFDSAATDTNPLELHIFTWNVAQNEVVGVVHQNQADGFVIKNRLKMFIQTFEHDGTATDYLVVYDEGHPYDAKDENKALDIRIFFNVERGNLKYDFVAQISNSTGFDIIYDLYPYRFTNDKTKNLILTTRKGKAPAEGLEQLNTNNVTLAFCGLDFDKEILECAPTTLTTNVTRGKVIVRDTPGDTGIILQIAVGADDLTVYTTGRNFQPLASQEPWIQREIYKYKNITYPNTTLLGQKLWIRDASLTQFGAVINFGRRNHLDAGLTILDASNEASSYFEGWVGAAFGRSFCLAQEVGKFHFVGLYRDRPFFRVMTNELKPGDNFYRVSATDGDSQGNFYRNAVLLETIFDRVLINNKFGELYLKDNEITEVFIEPRDIKSGNGLNLRIKVDPPELLTAIARNYDLAKLNITGPVDLSKGTYQFTANTVVVNTPNNSLVWSTCGHEPGLEMAFNCTQQGSLQMGREDSFKRRIKSRKSIIAAYSANNTASTLYLLGAGNSSFVKHFPNQRINDIGLVSAAGNVMYAMVAHPTTLDVYVFSPTNLTGVSLVVRIDAAAVDRASFCPQGINTAKGGSETFDILNSCPDKSSHEVIRWSFLPNETRRVIQLENSLNAIQFCSGNEELLFRGLDRSYSISIEDDFNVWTLPDKEINRGQRFLMFCLENINKAAFVTYDNTGGSPFTVSTMNLDKGFNQLRRFPTILRNVAAEEIEIFDFMGYPLIAVYNADSTEYIVPYDAPVVRFIPTKVNNFETVSVSMLFETPKASHQAIQNGIIENRRPGPIRGMIVSDDADDGREDADGKFWRRVRYTMDGKVINGDEKVEKVEKADFGVNFEF